MPPVAEEQPAPTQYLVPAYGGLIGIATLIIWAGAHASLHPAKKEKKEKKDEAGDESSDEEEPSEYIDSETAMYYPILASVMLVGLWMVLKYLDDELITLVSNVLFGLGGIGSAYGTLESIQKSMTGPRLRNFIPRYRFLLMQGPKELFKLRFTLASLVLLPLACLPSYGYVFNTPFDYRQFAVCGGLLAISFGFNALKAIKLDTFRTGVFLLSGLFLYDIWWVFGTRVMVDVATKLNVPIKILMPKNFRMTQPRDFMLLGLGDVVVPGLFVALALRYDQARHRASSSPGRSFSKPYFYATLVSYVLGLGVTMGIMHFTHHAQPALLYLSPAAIISFLLTSTIRGEFGHAWAWNDEEEQPDKATDAAGDTKKTK